MQQWAKGGKKSLIAHALPRYTISGKSPTILAHGLGGICIVNEHPQQTQKFWVFPQNIEFAIGKDTKKRNVV